MEWLSNTGAGHAEVAVGYSNLGKLMIARRKFSDAEPLLRRAEEIDRQNFAPDHPRIGYDLLNEGVAAVGRKALCGCGSPVQEIGGHFGAGPAPQSSGDRQR